MRNIAEQITVSLYHHSKQGSNSGVTRNNRQNRLGGLHTMTLGHLCGIWLTMLLVSLYVFPKECKPAGDRVQAHATVASTSCPYENSTECSGDGNDVVPALVAEAPERK